MSDLSPQRKRVVVLCAAVACMGGGPVLLKEHPILLGGWIGLMLLALVYALVQFKKLKRQGQ